MKALVIKNLKKTYSSGQVALRGIDLVVEQGDFFALLGPNGAGKTTTIGIITSLVNKSSGEVSLFGYDTERAAVMAKSCIGVVPQEFNFNFFERVIDILINQAGYYGIPRAVAYTRAEQYLTQLGLWDKRHVVSRELSGGMKRRLMIARALIHQPKMLILDEPTAGVDIELRRSMWTFLRQINTQGTTIILTTHYLEEAESLCRGIAIINKGEIIENSSIKELLSRLKTETIVVDLKRPVMVLPVILGCEIVALDETTLEITFPKTHYLNAIFLALSKLGVEVISMRNKANRLEELFIRLVSQ
jgi:ABC-2 type transport system ATP-binding protein